MSSLEAWRATKDAGHGQAAPEIPRAEAPCRQNGRVAVLLVSGQSNAANAGEERYTPVSDKILNFNAQDGRCYKAADPLLGSTGPGGSVWSRLGDKLVARGLYDAVIIAPAAMGGGAIENYIPGGIGHPAIINSLKSLLKSGLPPTHFLWHQGESDSRPPQNSCAGNAPLQSTETFTRSTPKERYVQLFGELLVTLRSGGMTAPAYVATATICDNFGDDGIREAQQEIPRRYEGVRPGPDTDTIFGPKWRYDGCHFTGPGLDRHAQMWADLLNQ